MATVPTYPIALVSKIMGVDEHTIRRLANAGVLTKPIVRGEWPITIVSEYIAHLKQQHETTFDQDSIASAGDVSELLEITPRRLRQLAQEGIVPKAERARYPLAACIRGYINYLQQLKMGTDERSQEATRLTSVRADSYELELQLKRKQLYHREVVDEALFKACTQLTAMLDGSASRIASQLGGGAALRKRLIDEFHEIRTQFAASLRQFSEHLRNDGWNTRATSRPRTRKVGKRKPRVAARKRGTRTV